MIHRRGRAPSRGGLASARGFSLLEIMVALVIMGTSLVLLIELFGSGLKNLRVAQNFTEAVFLASAKMEEELATPKVQARSENGRFEDTDYRWRVEIAERPEESSQAEDADDAGAQGFRTRLQDATVGLKLYDVTVTVFWGGRPPQAKPYRLSTVRLALGDDQLE